jgi:hypothetical protein
VKPGGSNERNDDLIDRIIIIEVFWSSLISHGRSACGKKHGVSFA